MRANHGAAAVWVGLLVSVAGCNYDVRSQPPPMRDTGSAEHPGLARGSGGAVTGGGAPAAVSDADAGAALPGDSCSDLAWCCTQFATTDWAGYVCTTYAEQNDSAQCSALFDTYCPPGNPPVVP